jgi:hypothetical protein
MTLTQRIGTSPLHNPLSPAATLFQSLDTRYDHTLNQVEPQPFLLIARIRTSQSRQGQPYGNASMGPYGGAFLAAYRAKKVPMIAAKAKAGLY